MIVLLFANQNVVLRETGFCLLKGFHNKTNKMESVNKIDHRLTYYAQVNMQCFDF